MTTPQNPVPSAAEASAVVENQEQGSSQQPAPLVPGAPHGAFERFDEFGRPEPAFAAGEAGTLLGFLEFQRATFRWRTSGLTEEQLRRRVDGHASGMTLGGMLKHLSFVEFFWFELTALGKPTSQPWVDVDWDADPDWDWHSADQDGAEDLRAQWEESVATSQGIVTELLGEDPAAGLAGTHPAWGGAADVSLRWIIVHMIEEYARHNGHADLLREQIDGQTGE